MSETIPSQASPTPHEPAGPSAEDVQAAISIGAKVICQCLLGFPATREAAWARCDYPERAAYIRAAEKCLTEAVPVLFRKDLKGKKIS